MELGMWTSQCDVSLNPSFSVAEKTPAKISGKLGRSGVIEPNSDNLIFVGPNCLQDIKRFFSGPVSLKIHDPLRLDTKISGTGPSPGLHGLKLGFNTNAMAQTHLGIKHDLSIHNVFDLAAL